MRRGMTVRILKMLLITPAITFTNERMVKLKKRIVSLLVVLLVMSMVLPSALAYSSTSPTTYKPWFGTVTDAPSGLKVRESASSTADWVYSLDDGDEIQVIGSTSGWYKVQYTTSGSYGYASSSYFTTKNTYCGVSSSSGTYMRSSAGGTSGGTYISYGTIVPYKVTSTISGVKWYYSVWGVTTGWISGSYLNV